MSFVVQKFGGTSVGTPERIVSVAGRIAAAHRKGDRLVVVVSAMGHSTDELLSLGRSVSKNPPHREMDMLLSAGERVSMALLSMALSDLDVPARSFTGSQSGIITDTSHRRARIRRILGDRVRETVERNEVAIVAGFQGVSETKDVTTLGRGGSDTTAVALAAALKADRCEIYTDVDGVYSADPRKVPGARLWKKIPYDLMLELAYRGAGVLHPRSVEIAKKFKVPLWVKNSQGENEGTLIISKEEIKDGMESFRFAGVTADKERMPLAIRLARPTVLGAVMSQASKIGLTVMSPLFNEGRAWLFVERDAQPEWKKLLDTLCVQEFVADFEFHADLVPLSVVGECISQDGTVFCRILDLLSENSVRVPFGLSSATAFTAAVPEHRLDDALRLLHAEFSG